MSTSVSSSERTLAPRRASHRLSYLILALMAAAGGLLVWAGWLRATAPRPPAVALDNTEPVVRETIEAARRRVVDHPYSDEAWGEFGIVLLAHSFHADAIRCFAQAENRNPREARWPYLQALAWEAVDPEPMLSCLERAARLCREETAPQARYGEALLECGRLEEAEAQFRAVLQQEPSNARAELGIGKVAYERGDLATSQHYLERCVARTSTLRSAHALLAKVYHQVGDSSRAEAARGEAARLKSDARWIDRYLQQVIDSEVGFLAMTRKMHGLIHERRLDEALSLLEQMKRQYPESGQVCQWMGYIQLRRNNPATAEPLLREAVRIEPNLIDANYYLAASLRGQNKLNDAVEAYRKTVQLQPVHAQAHYEMGSCLSQLGENPAAIDAFRAAVRHNPDLADAQKELGVLLLASGQRTEALTHLRQAAALRPKDRQVKRLLDQLEAEQPKGKSPH